MERAVALSEGSKKKKPTDQPEKGCPVGAFIV